MQNSTDSQLVQLYLEGDEKALQILIERYLKPVYNFVYRLVLNAKEAEDITQESFVKVWKNLKKYRQGESFKAWFFAIVRNTAFDHLRKRKDFVFSDFENEEGENYLTDGLADPAPLPEKLIEKTQDKEFLENALNKLSPRYREVLILHYNDHLTFDEIGKILGKSLNTVKSQHRRALIKLRELLDAPNK